MFALCKKAAWGPAVFSCPQLLTLLVTAMGSMLCLSTPWMLLYRAGVCGSLPQQCCCSFLQHRAPAPAPSSAQHVAFSPVNLCQTLVPILRDAVLCSGHGGGKAVQALTHSKNPRGNMIKGTQWNLPGFLLFHEIKGVIRKIQTEQKSP